jgi:hypothetical protein
MILPRKQVPRLAINVVAVLVNAVAAALSAEPAVAAPVANAGALPACSGSAVSMSSACSYDAADNFWVNTAKCQNESSAQERAACATETRQHYQADLALCREQKLERLDICNDLGQAPYDPQVNPANFVQPLQIGASVAANPYLILTPGYTRVYNSPSEVITIAVTHDTTDILGVTCIVSRDTVRDLAGNLIEDTLDYFAQDLSGNVWYFGETTAEYEGEFPVSVDGTFKAGVDRAKPGIAMLAALPSGKLYREEFALGSAEDLAEVITTSATESAPAASCRQSCLLTDNFTPIKPGSSEKKYYAPGIGEIVAFPEDDPGNREVLVSYHY